MFVQGNHLIVCVEHILNILYSHRHNCMHANLFLRSSIKHNLVCVKLARGQYFEYILRVT